MVRTKKSVPLGSGIAYIVEYTQEKMPSAAELVALATDENKSGETKGGATFTYTANVHKETDDHGSLMRIITLDEEAKIRWGQFSWAPDALTKLSSTGRVVKDGDYTVIKLGGLQNDDGKRYIVIFKQIDPELGDLYLALVGTNTAGITVAFARDATSKLEPEFTALPCDEEGTLAIMFEALPKTAAGTEQTEGE